MISKGKRQKDNFDMDSGFGLIIYSICNDNNDNTTPIFKFDDYTQPDNTLTVYLNKYAKYPLVDEIQQFKLLFKLDTDSDNPEVVIRD
jgi:hypothetical protein